MVARRRCWESVGRCRYPLTCCDSATRTGLEPATSAVTGRRANQLRYRAKRAGRRTSERTCSFGWCRTPNGIRTRAAAVKGRCPGPLDDGGLPDPTVTCRGPVKHRGRPDGLQTALPPAPVPRARVVGQDRDRARRDVLAVRGSRGRGARRRPRRARPVGRQRRGRGGRRAAPRHPGPAGALRGRAADRARLDLLRRDARPHHRVPAADPGDLRRTWPTWWRRCASPWFTRSRTTSASTTTPCTTAATAEPSPPAESSVVGWGRPSEVADN